MYRIEVSPGEETAYRTIDELATAVRRGFVTARSRIYHNATQKWLPIEFHPHYRKIIENPDAKTLEAPAPPRASIAAPGRAGTAVTPAVSAAPAIAVEPLPPPPLPSPVLELPKIAYPQITPLEAPVPMFGVSAPRAAEPAGRPLPPWRMADDPLALPEWPREAETADEAIAQESRSEERRSPSARRWALQLAAAVAVAAVGYAVLSAFAPPRNGSAPESPSQTLAERPVMPPATAAPTPRPRPASVPTSVTAGFAAALPDRPAAVPAPSSVSPDNPAIAPAPTGVEMTLPSVTGADSLVVVPRPRSDSAAIKRILRAVSGKPPTDH